MDTAKCAALLKVLELGSLSAAAEALGYTPSGVSRMRVRKRPTSGTTRALLTTERNDGRGVVLRPAAGAGCRCVQE